MSSATAVPKARGATLRQHLVNVPARITRPHGRPTLHLPEHWPHAASWNTLWTNVFTTSSRQSPPDPRPTNQATKAATDK